MTTEEEQEEASRRMAGFLATPLGKLLTGSGVATLIAVPLYGTFTLQGASQDVRVTLERELQEVGRKLSEVEQQLGGLRQDFRVEQAEVRAIVAQQNVVLQAKLDMLEQRIHILESAD